MNINTLTEQNKYVCQKSHWGNRYNDYFYWCKNRNNKK